MFCYITKGTITVAEENEEQFLTNIEATRFLWNHYLNIFNERENSVPRKKKLHIYDLNKLVIELKKEFPFLKKADSQCLIEVNKDIIFKSKKPRKNPERYTKPEFRDENSPQTFTAININNTIRIENDNIRLPKIGWVPINLEEDFIGRIKKVRVTRISPGIYEAELLILNDYKVNIGYGEDNWNADPY